MLIIIIIMFSLMNDDKYKYTVFENTMMSKTPCLSSFLHDNVYSSW